MRLRERDDVKGLRRSDRTAKLLDLAADRLAHLRLGHFQVVLGLQPKSDPGRRVNEAHQAQRRVGRDGTLAMHVLADPQRRQAEIDCDQLLLELEWLQDIGS